MKKIVILGAGIGGLSVINELRQSHAPLEDLDITIVDEDFAHFLGFTLPWVMRGWRDAESVPIRPSAQTLSGITTVTGSVVGIDTSARTVSLSDSSTLDFDALVIATGARNALDKIPGLSEAAARGDAVHYYGVAAAGEARRALEEFSGGKLVFLVTSQPYRCPVAPYEGALLASDLLNEKNIRASVDISVYTPEKHPMPSAGPYAGPQLVELLGDNKIAFHGEHATERIDPDEKVVVFEDGSTVSFDLLVFVPPHEPSVTIDGAEWIGVDPQTMQTTHEGIWAIGDTTSVTSPSGRPLPKAAIFAKNGAKAATQNLLHYLDKSDRTAELSGLGYCYLDTGQHRAAQGKGDFFTLPHPAITLTEPSTGQHRDKQDEEAEWRDMWESRSGA
ncbi:NAD(P)/FAD-dependent oxidoreductase [Mycobacterium sp. CBMA271]|uniref:NAD(P)/FAD-dependent oxidoreductase n=1 Tax=unclassified Mycobacteroides TaxID=2618759 RepID=UPI0012DF8C20|nr:MULTISPECIES: FAD-dependent oxidoreductase [unclassified Mycobacteroides]MUM19331.1 dehydrogenase [Mycobacteroides sp. CBMA 326]MUM21744.1 NAD(P)/FAD-dependent oxidoreductase [Mycobacteroides sp. CBMA 271]